MKYRLIAPHMDGTLLNTNNEITPHTLAVINSAREKGVIFTLSTGRPLQGVRKYIEQHPEQSIAIIAPYNNQVQLLRKTLGKQF